MEKGAEQITSSSPPDTGWVGFQERWDATAPMPSSVEVGPFVYTIVRRRDGGATWATTNHRLREIMFDAETPPEQSPITLIHELLHIVHRVYDVEDDAEEETVARLAHGLAQALQSLGLLPMRLDFITPHDDPDGRPRTRGS